MSNGTAKWIEGTGTTLTITPTGGSGFTLDWTEITIAPLQGGDKIDTSSLGNTRYMTGMAKTLIETGDISFTGELSAAAYSSAITALNKLGTATIVVGNSGGTFVFKGYLKDMTPGAITVGDKITMSGSFAVTNTTVTALVATEVAPTAS